MSNRLASGGKAGYPRRCFFRTLSPSLGLLCRLPNVFGLCSPVSMSETSSSVEDRFAWENCGSSLVLMRNCAARFADSADPSRAFRSVSRCISHMVSLNPLNSRQQSKMCWTDCVSAPQGQFRESSALIECR